MIEFIGNRNNLNLRTYLRGESKIVATSQAPHDIPNSSLLAMLHLHHATSTRLLPFLSLQQWRIIELNQLGGAICLSNFLESLESSHINGESIHENKNENCHPSLEDYSPCERAKSFKNAPPYLLLTPLSLASPSNSFVPCMVQLG